MEALQTRIKQLSSLRNDAFRLHEHTTLDRLMYKNRNQHRRGPYFQRLEHVRRMLRKINNHATWTFVRNALPAALVGSSKQKPITKRRKSKLHPISAQTACDFEDLVARMKSLVETIIPKAASRITLELICRSHFLPFAIAVVAALARIYSIERALLREMQGISADVRILTAPPIRGVNLGKDEFAGNSPAVEDIGEIIRLEDCKDLEVQKEAQLQKPVHLPGSSKAGRRMVNRFCAVENRSNGKQCSGVQEDVKSSVNDESNEDSAAAAPLSSDQQIVSESGPSLYELMAEEDPELASIAETHVVSTMRISIDETLLSVQHSQHNFAQAEQTAPGKAPAAVVACDEKDQFSESEDLDDIFANLSD